MRTNIVLDDKLVKRAFACAPVKTKKELVHLALREFVTTRRRRSLAEIRGMVRFRDDYDYKKLRRDRVG